MGWSTAGRLHDHFQGRRLLHLQAVCKPFDHAVDQWDKNAMETGAMSGSMRCHSGFSWTSGRLESQSHIALLSLLQDAPSRSYQYCLGAFHL